MDWTLLKRLSEVQAVSAYETPVARIILDAVRELADETFVDGFGNAVAKRRGSDPRRTLMLAAHQDEIGLMIKYVRDDGFLRVAPRGNLMVKYLIGREVDVLGSKGPLYGLLESEDQGIHGIVDPTEAQTGGKATRLTIDDLFVDVGAKSAEEVEAMGIRVGDPVAFRSDFRLFEERGFAVGKAIDDRIGCFIMIEAFRLAAERGHKSNIAIVGTCQEESINVETALRGAEVSARHIAPDAALIIEPVLTGGMPGTTADKDNLPIPARFDGGPVIFRGSDCHPLFTEFLIGICEDLKMRYQLMTGYDFGTDALRIRASGNGVATGIIGPTARYHHTPHQFISLRDTEDCITAVVELLVRFDDSINLGLG